MLSIILKLLRTAIQRFYYYSSVSTTNSTWQQFSISNEYLCSWVVSSFSAATSALKKGQGQGKKDGAEYLYNMFLCDILMFEGIKERNKGILH